MKVDLFDFDSLTKIRAEQERKAKNKENALQSGAEEYTAEAASQFYWPDELASDDEAVMGKLRELEDDYYRSGFKTIEAWAKAREEYDGTKDS